MKIFLAIILLFFSFSTNAGGFANELYQQELEYQVEYLEQKIENQLPQDNEDEHPRNEEFEQRLEYDRKMLDYYQQRLEQVR